MNKHVDHSAYVDARSGVRTPETLVRHREQYRTVAHPITGDPVTLLLPDTEVLPIKPDGSDFVSEDGSIPTALVAQTAYIEDDDVTLTLQMIPKGALGIPETLLQALGLMVSITDTGVCTAEGMPIVIAHFPEAREV